MISVSEVTSIKCLHGVGKCSNHLSLEDDMIDEQLMFLEEDSEYDYLA
jgi:hypothetical protein